MPKWKTLLGVLILLVAIYQGAVAIRASLSPLQMVWKAIGKSGAWRAANFSAGQEFANYLEFLLQAIPPGAVVLLPPEGVGPSFLSRTPYMQFFLSPREVVNCSGYLQACASGYSESGAYILVSQKDGFPAQDVLQDERRLRMYNQDLGVYRPIDAPVAPLDQPGNTSLLQIAGRLFWPLAWLALLIAGGWLVVASLGADLSLSSQASLGFGLGTGAFSLLLYLALLPVEALVPPASAVPIRFLAIGLGLACALAGLVFYLRNKRQPRRAKSLTGPELVYLGLFALLALLAAALAVGQGYHWSDEVVLWGVKGYGIADIGLARGVSEWGTRTASYPLHLPLLIAVFRALFGDGLPESKIIFPGYYLGLALLIFNYLRKALGDHLAGGLTLAFAAAPLVFYQASLAYANLPLTFYLVGALLLINNAFNARDSNVLEMGQGAAAPVTRGQPSRQSSTLFLGGIYLMFAAWTRPEGLVMSILIVLLVSALLAWRERNRQVIGAVLALSAPTLVFALLWPLTASYVYQRPSWSGLIFGTGLASLASGGLNLAGLLLVLRNFLAGLLDSRTWGVFGIGLIVLALLTPLWLLRRPRLNLTLAAGLLCTLAILGMYGVIANNPLHNLSWWIDTGLDRMLIPGVTLTFLGIVETWRSL